MPETIKISELVQQIGSPTSDVLLSYVEFDNSLNAQS